MGAYLSNAKDVATVVIAAYVASVGTFQWITARDKLRLDLYNRRFEAYSRYADFIPALMGWADVPEEQKKGIRLAFYRTVRESQFLFADDPRIHELFKVMNQKSFAVTGFLDEMGVWLRSHKEGNVPSATIENFSEKNENLLWIMSSTEKLEALLLPYLAFDHRRTRRFSFRLLPKIPSKPD